MKKRLTEASVQRLSPDPNKRIEIYDELASGLMLRITPNGKKTWSMVYRVAGVTAEGKRGPLRRMTLGAYPLVSLKEARAKCGDLMELVDRGIDPVNQRKGELDKRRQRIFHVLLDKFIELHAKAHTKNWGDTETLLKRTFEYGWREQDIGALTRADVHELLDRLISDRNPSYASEMRRKLSKFFNWSVDRGLIASSPMAGMRRPELSYVARERVLEMDELTRIWQAAGEVGYPFGPIVQLLILTGQRRSEVANLQRAWLMEDRAGFEIPASAYKTKRRHVVPLTKSAQRIIEAQPIWNGGDHVFSTTNGRSPASGFSRAKARFDRLTGIEGWTFHDIRRSVATHMARLQISQEHIERVLGHVIEGVAGTYNRYSYFDEKLAALEAWEREFFAKLR